MCYILMIAGGILIIILAVVLQRWQIAPKWRKIDPQKLNKKKMKQVPDVQTQMHKPIKRKPDQ